MPAFELISYARQMLAPSSPTEVLAHAGRAAEAVHAGAPAFVVHLAPGKGWQQSLVVEVNGALSTPSPAANSALFALYRRLSSQRTALHLERSEDFEPIFKALSPEMGQLHVLPLKIRDGRFTGMLVSAAPY